MERRSLLKTLLLGLGYASLPRPVRRAFARGAARSPRDGSSCWITPEETAGPFYFDPNLLRQDIREDRLGVPLDLEMTVIDENCVPVPGVLVDVWHCDRGGCYSGYSQVTCNAVGETFLRGTQLSDAEGKVRFTTVYPGWYPGRATHIHFKARSEDAIYKTSQFAFLDSVNDTVYASPLYADRGPNPTSNAQDGIFHADEPLYLTAEANGDPANGYQAAFTMGLEAGITSVEADSAEDALELAGWPTAFRRQATLEASLGSAGEIALSIHDAQGRRLRRLAAGYREAGRFRISWDGRDEQGRNLPAGVYLAVLEQAGRKSTARLVRLR
ncbi:MAG: FlgD immunoglobulin-like domain containing protein [Candidatus Krumholzibacteriia bacterium]